MATSNINIRVDTELKRSAERLFDDLGLSMTSAITMFLKSAVLNNGIPSEVRRIPNAETRAALAEHTAMKQSPDSYKRYDSFSDLVAELTGV